MINACQILVTLVENVILIFKGTKEKFDLSVALNLLNPSHRHAFEEKRKEIFRLPSSLIENKALSKPVRKTFERIFKPAKLL